MFVIGNKKDIGAFEKNAIKPVAKAYRGKAIITSVDIDDSATSGILNYFVGSDKPETLTVRVGGSQYCGTVVRWTPPSSGHGLGEVKGPQVQGPRKA